MSVTTDLFRISHLATKWEEIFAARAGERDVEWDRVRSAQEKVFARYGECVYRYLFGATRSYIIADELAQEFALRFLRGDLDGAHPAKGRFRDYLKATLSNLVNDYYRRSNRNRVGELNEDAAIDCPFEEIEQEFNEAWRRNAIQQAWQDLEQFESERNNFFYTVLRLRTKYPLENSRRLAQRLSDQLNFEVTDDWVRQKLHRARQKFAGFLVTEVRKTVVHDDQLDDELAELGLLKYL